MGAAARMLSDAPAQRAPGRYSLKSTDRKTNRPLPHKGPATLITIIHFFPFFFQPSDSVSAPSLHVTLTCAVQDATGLPFNRSWLCILTSERF